MPEESTTPDLVAARSKLQTAVTLEWMVIELEQIMDADDRLVSIHRVRVKARHTGIDFDGRMAHMWRFRAGKTIHFQGFQSPKRALEAAGLEG